MTDEQLQKRNNFLELMLAGYRRRFAPFCQPRRYEVDRKDVIELVAYWRQSLDTNNIWYEDNDFFDANARDAEEMLARISLSDWRECIDWFWKIKDSHKFWSKVAVVKLSTMRKAQPQWMALKSKDDETNFDIYDK